MITVSVSVLVHTPGYAPQHSRHCFEAAFSSTMRIARTLTGEDIRPREVGFSHPLPVSLGEYHRIFKCPVRFDQKCTYMVLDIRIGGIPVLSPNPARLKQFETYASDFLNEIEEDDTVSRKVRKYILSCLGSRNLTINTVAREMAMIVRSLQSRLKGEDKVFSGVLQETREELAKKWLEEQYTVEDITFMLGFAAPSVFRKAFKKRTGQTPGKFREAAVPKAS